MKMIISILIRLLINTGKFAVLIYSLYLLNVNFNSKDQYVYLQKEFIKINLGGIFVQENINSNIKRINNNHLKGIKKIW